MQWNISFDICAFLILSLFCGYTLIMNRFKSRLNLIYDAMCVIVLCSVVLDVLAVFFVEYIEIVTLYAVYAAKMLYMLLINALAVGLYWYVLELVGAKKQPAVLRWINMLPFAVDVFLILSTPWLKLSIYIDENNVYQYGPYAQSLYILSGYYILLSLVYILRNRRKISKQSRFAFSFFYILLVTSLMVQALEPQLLMVGIASAAGLIAFYLAQLNPNVGVDSETNVFNKDAFYMSVAGHISEGNNFSVIAFEPDDFDAFAEKYGEITAKEVLKSIAAFLLELVNAQAVYYLEGNRFAILLGSRDRSVPEETLAKYYYASHVFAGNSAGNESAEDRIVLQALLERFDQSWVIGDDEYELSASICFLTYPEDASRADEVNDMIESSLRQARDIGSGTFIYASEYVKTREKYISELQMKQAELEDMTRRAEQARLVAEQADNSKSRFIANMSHEIRTPMNAIVGMTELVLRDEVNEQVRRNVKNIQSAGNTLITLINDILDFSKMEAGKQEIVHHVYDSSSLLNNVLSVSSTKMAGKNLDLIVNVDPTLPSQFMGDEIRLRQIITNLLNNAIKYTEKGTVTLRIGWSLTDSDAEDEAPLMALLKVSVIDTGCGIREEDMDKLFKSFVRIEERRNHLIEGSGLGLSICKQLLDLMGGEIIVESEYGKGSNFSFVLPQEIVDMKAFTYVEDADQMNVLVFAEDASLRNGLSAVLRQLNVECVAASSGYEMETALDQQSFSHVFIEYSKFDDVKELLDMAGDAKIILTLRSRQLMNRREDMASVQQPFSCMNVADALNYTRVRKSSKNAVETYFAPTARVLAVDDNMINLQVIVGLLQPHKIKVDTADGGRECLRLVQKNRYDLVLMDHVMPEMGGIETLRAIRNLEGAYYKNLPVVAVTATAMNGIREMFEAAGFQSYIPKPIDIKQLEDVVLRFISSDKITYGTAELLDETEEVLYIPGVNTELGIAQCGGSRKNYLSLLQIVVADGREKLEVLERCRESENYETYRIEVHALKSVAASIGANELSYIAAEQENACKENRISEVSANHRKLCNKYSSLLDFIGLALVESGEESEDEVMAQTQAVYTEERFRDRMVTVLALLHDFEEDVAVRMLQELGGAKLEDEEKQLVNELLHKSELFLYDEAQAQIEAYLGRA